MLRTLLPALIFSLYTNATLATDRSNSVVEMTAATKQIVAAYKKGGVAAMSAATDACYAKQKTAFRCGYLDIAGRYIDFQVTQQLNLPVSSYYANENFGERFAKIVNAANMDQEKANEYLRMTSVIIAQLVDKETANR